jgi:CubicO group peptidase (beta-lactamase class C family)
VNPRSSTDAVDAIVRRFDAPGAPGVAVGVYRNGEPLHTAVAGRASLEHDVSVTPATLFNIASVSKQFTAACVLLLEAGGKLSIDDDVRDHVSDVQLKVPVTLRQCLQHTGGLREYMTLHALVGAGPETYCTEDAVIGGFRRQRDTNFEPGTEWSYSNTGYVVLAAIVRAITGQSLGEFARDRIFVPLGMTATQFQEDPGAVIPHKASGYMKSLSDPNAEGYRNADSLDEAVGDGGLLTNVVDLARWNGFLADGRVLGVEIRDRLFQRAELNDGCVLPYAMGIEHTKVCGAPAVGHGGNIEGYHAHLIHLLAPGEDGGLGVACLTNRNDVDPSRVVREVAAAALGRPHPPRPAWTGSAPASPDGMWLDAQNDLILELTANDRGGIDVDFGPIAVPFVERDGRWWPEKLELDVSIAFDGDRFCYSSGDDDWHPFWFDRLAIDGVGADAALAGTYHSTELDALATISTTGEGLTIAIGASPASPLRAASNDLYRQATSTLRVERDSDGRPSAVLFSGGRIRRVRFDRAADGTTAVGFPAAFR